MLWVKFATIRQLKLINVSMFYRKWHNLLWCLVSSGTAESDLTTAEQILLVGGSFPVLLALYVAVAVVAVVFTIMFIIILVLCIRQRKPRLEKEETI